MTAIKRAPQQQKRKAQDENLITCLTDIIALALQCYHKINSTRRQPMKKDFHKDYTSLSKASTVPASSEYLF